MFEVEVQHSKLSAADLPSTVRSQFADRGSLTHVSPTVWEEHCTECAWPTCYTTCDLYNPRNDGHCRRTLGGFSPIPDTTAVGGQVVRVSFKRWCNLTTRLPVHPLPLDEITAIEGRMNSWSLRAASLPRLGTLIGRPGLPSRVMRKVKSAKIDELASRGEDRRAPDCFWMEVHNPSGAVAKLSIVISQYKSAEKRIPFMELLSIKPGFQRVEIPFDRIEPHLGPQATIAFVSINPNVIDADQEGLTLDFGLMAFVRRTAARPAAEAAPAAKLPAAPSEKSEKAGAKKVKVVIWDLDNTLWNGTLVEDGPGRELRPHVRETIEALDARGIVNSVASKNHEDAAMAELERLGLKEYFVFPVVGWKPKSDSVRAIVKAFNVGEDTIAFIDDQPFEREEVLAFNPKVRAYDQHSVESLLTRPEFDVPVTEEARERRRFYQNEEVRQKVLKDESSDYLSFLRSSDINIRIIRAGTAQLERIHELVQRTNQMNFSGNRYTKEDLQAILDRDDRECYLIDAVDRFGQYGYIGFAVLALDEIPRVVDLAFSCRIQSKYVEHAVLDHLTQRAQQLGAPLLDVFYRKTAKNTPVGQVFEDLSFQLHSQEGADHVYRVGVDQRKFDPTIIKVQTA